MKNHEKKYYTPMFNQGILRVFILVAFFAASFSALYGQARFGILAGPHSAAVFETNNVADWFTVRDYYKKRFSFHAGVTLDVPFPNKSPLHFQPALIYSGKGRKFEPGTGSGIIALRYVKQEQFVNYLDLPLNLILKFPVGKDARFIFGGGPQPSFLIGGKETIKIQDEPGDPPVGTTSKPKKGSGSGEYKGIDFGLNGLLGFEFGRVFLTVNYSRGFSNFYTSDYDGKFRNYVIGGTLGVFFGRSQEGKAKDRDKDGIPNISDGCPSEAGPSNTNGCPDKDGDGIADKYDKCPDSTGLAEYQGCPPPDRDHDGIVDSVDKCPDVAGLAIYEGCPIPDADKDGVNDFEDRCPTVAGTAANKGCPIADADGDGVADKDDKCPQIKGISKYNGCPVPDTDGDGLNDDDDKCITVAGPKTNNGCPVIAKDIIDKLTASAQQIKFVSLKADIQASSYKVLDQVAKILKQNPSIVITITSYANVLKTQSENQKLAIERSNNIMAYIGLQGVDWQRMKANGYATSPAPTTAGAKNTGNRTEFIIGN